MISCFRHISAIFLFAIVGIIPTAHADTFNLGSDISIDEGSGTVMLTVTRSGSAPLGEETIFISTINDTATGGSDFTALTSFPLTFPINPNASATQDTAQITLTLNDDTASECEERFEVTAIVGAGNNLSGGNVVITIEESDFLTLPWDDGSLDIPASPSGSLVEQTTNEGIFCYKIITNNAPLWRTRLTVTAGEADLELHRGAFTANDSADHTSNSSGSDGILLYNGQFQQSQEWYIRVTVTQPNTSWSLFSGSVFTYDQGTLITDTGYTGPAFSQLPFPPEGALFFTATPPAGAKAWALWTDGHGQGTNQANIAIRKNQPGLPNVSGRFDFREADKMLVVPPYLGSQLDTYFVSIDGDEGALLDFHSHLIEPQVLSSSFNAVDTTQTESGAPFAIFEVDVPLSFIAWDVVLENTDSGDPHLALRQGDVGSQWVNDAYSENDVAIADDSITVVPPVLTDGIWYATLYADGPFQTDIRNGQPEFTGALTNIDFLDDDAQTDAPILQPGNGPVPNPKANRSGWTYFRASKISEQSGLLGWDLSLLNQKPGTELAVRQNAVPSRLYRRNATSGTLNGSSVSTSILNAYDDISDLGFLQRPSQQADVWYVGVHLRDDALGPYSLQRQELVPDSGDPVNQFSDTVTQLPRTWQFYRFDLLDGILGWETKIRDVVGGNPRLVIRRALLPNQLSAPAPSSISNFINGQATTLANDWFSRPSALDHHKSLLLVSGDPLITDPGIAITYYAGIFNDSEDSTTYTFNSEVIDDDLLPYSTPAGNPVNLVETVNYDSGNKVISSLPAGVSRFFKVSIPANKKTWRLRLANTSGDARMSVRKGFLPDYESRLAGDADTSHGGIELERDGADVYQLLPRGNQEFLQSGDYYISVTAELASTFSGTLTSEGEIPITALSVPAPQINQAYSIPADEIQLYEFDVPANALAVEIRLDETSGKTNFTIRNDALIARPFSTPIINSYGYDGGNTPNISQQSIHTLQNPAAGTYSLTLRAEPTGGIPAASSGNLVITLITAASITPESNQVVSNHIPQSWRYFEINFPADGILTGDSSPILAWNPHITSFSGGDPRIVITKNQAHPQTNSVNTQGFSPSNNPSKNTSWQNNASWTQILDFSGRSSNADTTSATYKSFFASWGKPLDGGTYYIGIYNSSSTESSSYTLNSRTVGEQASSSSIQVMDLAFSGGSQPIPNLPAREISVFRVTTPAGGIPSWRTQLQVSDNNEACLSIRQGFVPDYEGGRRQHASAHPEDEVAGSNGGGVQIQKNGSECYNLFPEEDEALLSGNTTYYLVATSEGQSPANIASMGVGNSSFTITSDGEIASNPVTLTNGLYTENLTLKAAEIKLITFTVPANSSSLEVALTNETGNDLTFALREGTLIPEAFFTTNSYRWYYGVDGGTRNNNFLNDSLVTIPEPSPGTYTLAIRSNASSETTWTPSSNADLRIEVLGPQVLDFCGGVASQTNQPALSWRYYIVDVPNDPDLLAWDIQVLESYTGGRPTLYVRKTDLPTIQPSPPTQSRITPWIDGRQLIATNSDWTSDSTRFSDGKTLGNTRDLLNFNQPLVPGRYIVGVYNNNSTEQTSYSIRSRCIGLPGSGANIIVNDLNADGGTTNLAVDPRESIYYKVTIPADTHRTWQLKLSTTPPDETTLVVNKDFIPNFSAFVTGNASNNGSPVRMQRVGNDIYTLLPDNGLDFLPGGTYYVAAVGRGNNGTSGNVGTGSVNATLTSTLDLPEINMGTVGTIGSSLSQAISLDASDLQIFQFTIPDSPALQNVGVIEIRLDNRVGSGWMSLRTDSKIPVPFIGGSSSFSYGVDGGSSASRNDDQIITLVNPAAGIYTLVVQARSLESIPIDTTGTLVVENIGVQSLAFDSAVATPQIPSTQQQQLIDGQKVYYKIDVPEFLTVPADGDQEEVILPILAWKLSLIETSGDVRMRVMQTLSATGGFTTSNADDIAIIVPPVLTPGGTYYVEVSGTGLADYEIRSRAENYSDTWIMPANYNVEFGDTSSIDLGEDDWNFHAIDIPKDNGGLLRTELISLSGNPDLYIREDGFPTINHTTNGSNGSIFNRSLTGTDTEYANWVPLNGRSEIELRPGRWVLGVRAKDTNSRYQLKVSTGNVQALDYANLQLDDDPADTDEVTDASVLSNDFVYYRFDIPSIPDTPSQLSITFTEDFGDVALHLRDTIPPGNSNRLPTSPTSATDFIADADDDNKNRWSYWTSSNSGLNNPGTTVFSFPELRPGSTYFIGVRGRLDGNFDLNVAPSQAKVTDAYGAITDVPFSGQAMGFDVTLGAGESAAFKIDVPDGATRWVSNHSHSDDVEFRLEQGTLPAFGAAANQVHRLRTGANTSFNQALNASWPWIPGQTYYALFTNTGAVSEIINFDISGEGESTRYAGWASSFSLSGPAATTTAINNSKGISNLMAYALGMDPTTGLANNSTFDPAAHFIISEDAIPFPGLEFHLPQNAPQDVCYVIEENPLLSGAWTELGTRAGNGGWVGNGFFIEGNLSSGYRRQRVFSPASLNVRDKNFLRLKIQLTHP